MWSVSSATDQSFDIYLPVPSFVAAFEGFESIYLQKVFLFRLIHIFPPHVCNEGYF